MGNAGEARLDVVALGRDEVSVAMNQVEAKLDALTKKLRTYEAAQRGSTSGAVAAAKQTSGLGEQLGALKDRFSTVNQGREVFENLRSNVGFVLGTVSSLVVGVGTLIAKFAESGSAAERLREMGAAYAKNLEDVDRLQGKIDAFLGRSRGAFEQITGDAAGEPFAKLTDQIMTVEERLRDIREEITNELFFGGAKLGDQFASMAEKLEHIRSLGADGLITDEKALRISKEFQALYTDRNDLARRRKQLEEDNLAVLREQERVLASIAKQEADAQNARISAALDKSTGIRATDLFATWATGTEWKGGKDDKKKSPGGGSGSGATEAWNAKIFELTRSAPRGGMSAGDWQAIQRTTQEAAGRHAVLGGQSVDDARHQAAEQMWLEQNKMFADQAAADAEALEKKRVAAAALADTLARMGEIVGQDLPASWASFSDAMAGAVGQMVEAEGADKRGVQGALAMVKATFALGAAEAKTARARNTWKALEAAGDAAMAAARYDYASMAVALIGVAKFGLAAAAAGGGGGGGGGIHGGARGGGGGRSSGGSGAGGGTYITNINALVADKQGVTRALQEAEGAGRRNGYRERRGA